MSNRKLYASYGTNMSVAAMKGRAPTATAYGKGRILDVRTAFSRYPLLIPEAGDYADVGVWLIDKEAEGLLDMYEGYPSYYEKTHMAVHLDGDGVVQCLVYLMTPECLEDDMPTPGHSINMTLDGYKDFDIDPDRLILPSMTTCFDHLAYNEFYRKTMGLDTPGMGISDVGKYIELEEYGAA